jgi:hypothetical protein
VLDGGETASKHETQIFVLVSYVLGTGQQGLRIQAGGRAARADMAFDLAGHDKFVVEYDGAYWHSGQEERDLRKNLMMRGAGYRVIRLREDPLGPIAPEDLVVPAQASAVACARIALLHLIHVMVVPRDDDELVRRIVEFVEAHPEPLAPPDLRCRECQHIAEAFVYQDRTCSRGTTYGALAGPPGGCRPAMRGRAAAPNEHGDISIALPGHTDPC